MEQGPGHAGDFRREAALRRPQVDANAQDGVVQAAGLKIHGSLGEDAADLPAPEVHVVDPLDFRLLAGELVDGLRHSHGGRCGDGEGFLRGEAGPQQNAEVQPRALGREETPAQAALALGLLLGDEGHSLCPALLGNAFEHRVGGGDGVPHLNGAALGRSLQQAADALGGEGVVRGNQLIAPVGGGLNLVAILPQALDGLPHGVAADPQLPGHLLPGEGGAGAFQQLQDFIGDVHGNRLLFVFVLDIG